MTTAPQLVGGQEVFYARVSTDDQSLDRQIEAAKNRGCIKIFQDKASGKNLNRPGFQEMLAYVRPLDKVVVWSIDRLGRNLRDLANCMWDLADKNIHIVSISEGLDTASSLGEDFFINMAQNAQRYRQNIQRASKSGVARRRAMGLPVGRILKFDQEAYQEFEELKAEGKKTNRQISKRTGITVPTFYRYRRKIADGEIILKQ